MAADLHSSVASSPVVVEAQRLFDGHRFIEPARVVITEPTTMDLGGPDHWYYDHGPLVTRSPPRAR